MIEVKNLCRTFGEFTAVDSVSFSIQPGEIVGLLGHNGAGKTTVMKMLTGFLEPSKGEIRINGELLETNPITARQLMGYLPENSPLYPEMIVIDYLDYTAQLRHIPNHERTSAIKAAVQHTALTEKLFEPISTLSRGYKQRLGVAQAIISRPKIVILDEPTNGLDPSQIHHMRRLIHSLRETSTVILSTHILQEVSAVCDRVLIMNHGKLALDTPLKNLNKTQSSELQTNATTAHLKDIAKDLPITVTPVISAISTDETNTFTLAFKEESTPKDLHAEIAKRLVENNFQLYSLVEQNRDLEAVFTDINSTSSSNSAKTHHSANSETKANTSAVTAE